MCLRVGEIRAAAIFPAKKQQFKGQVQHNAQCTTANFCFAAFCISLHADATPLRHGESIAFYKLNFSLLLLDMIRFLTFFYFQHDLHIYK